MCNKTMKQQPQTQTCTPPIEITTEQIQKLLDDNKQLIMAMLENQNLGKSADCALYQIQLQQNLMYLAKIADAQSQASKMPSQMTTPSPQSPVHQEHNPVPSQAQPTMSQQQGFIAVKATDRQQHQLVYVQQQQLIPDQMGTKPVSTASSIYQPMQTGHENKLDYFEESD